MKIETNNLPLETIEEIENSINIELTKRGFPSVKASQDTKEIRYPRITLISEEFNTTPAIMKSIVINNFGGSISRVEREYIGDDENGERVVKKGEVIRIWVDVHVSYEHFDGGSNGTKLFDCSWDLHETESSRKGFYLSRMEIR